VERYTKHWRNRPETLSASKKEESPVSSPAKRMPTEQTDIPITPVVKPQKQQQVKKQVQVERKERQLNAWITATQNDTLDQLYFRLRAQGMRLKKGELVGIGIEILATILEQISPEAIDRTLLNIYLSYYEKQKQKDT
jgi:hypothetical protein